MVEFNKQHGSLTGIKHSTVPILDKDFLDINVRFIGGGMSQNILSIYIIEHLIQALKPEYIVEIGSQKGALSLYLGNMASATEQFLFHTFEINKNDNWYNREREGVGHWFDKLCTVSPYMKSFEQDCFSKESIDLIQSNVSKYRTLMICDGGSKIKEHHTYGPLLKSGDVMMLHDFPSEITEEDLNWNLFKKYEPFCKAFEVYQTKFRAIQKI